MTMLNIPHQISEVDLRDGLAKVKKRWNLERLPTWLIAAKVMSEIKEKKERELGEIINQS